MTIALLLAAAVGAFFAALWRGERQYRLGVRHGRRLEALDAKHARDRVLLDAAREVALGAIKHAHDERLIAGWVLDAQPGRRR